MSVTFNTSAFKARETTSDPWSSLILQVDADVALDPVVAEYDATNGSYVPGDYALHEGLVYRCKAATSGAWASASWELTTIGAEFTASENRTASEIGVVIDGNKTNYASGASAGQYVILKNSTISGCPDGLYVVKSGKTVPYNTAIDGTYIDPVNGGGLNSLKNTFKMKSKVLPFNTISAGSYQEVSDSTLQGKPIVGWELSSVASKNVSLLAVHCGLSVGMFARLKNNGSDSVSGAQITIYYLDV